MDTILVAIDFSAHSETVLKTAVALANEHEASLVITHVVDDLERQHSWLILVETPQELEDAVKVLKTTDLKKFYKDVVKTPLPEDAVTFDVRVGSAVDELLDSAKESQADMVIAGTAGHGLVLSTLLGSTANQLIRQCELPVWIVPSTSPLPLKRILVPVDHSAISRATLQYALKLAKQSQAELHVIHSLGVPVGIADPVFSLYEINPTSITSLQRSIEDTLTAQIKAMGSEGVSVSVNVILGDAADEIKQWAADHDVDLICIGTHGRRGIRRFLMGNTAERVLRSPPCSVLVLRDEAEHNLLGG